MKKWIYMISSLTIIGFVLIVYSSFNGNVVSRIMAKNVAQKFIEQEYPELNLQLVDKGYNFKFGTYDFEFDYKEGTNIWTMYITVGPSIWPSEVEELALKYDSKDESTSTKWSDEGTAYVEKLLNQEIQWNELYYTIDVPRNFEDEHPEWQPTIDVPTEPFINIDVIYEGQTEQEFIEQAKNIQRLLQNSGLRVGMVIVTTTEEIDNLNGSKEGYAPIYYETRHHIRFTLNQEINKDTIQR